MNYRFKPTLCRSLCLLWCSHLILDFFTGIWPIYKTLFHIDLAKAGILAGISGFMGESLQLGFGYISDRGHRKVIMMLGLGLASSILWMTFTEHLFFSFCLLFLMMLGSSSFHPAAVGFASKLSENHKGRYILLFSSSGAIGLAISQLTFTKTIAFFNGHALIFYIPVLILLVLLLFYPLDAQTETTPFSIKQALQLFLQHKRLLLPLYLIQIANVTLSAAFIFLLPDLMQTKECHIWLCQGGAHFCFILGGAVCMIITGYLCDRYNYKYVLLTVTISALFLFYSFLLQTSIPPWKTVIFLTCLGGMIGTMNPLAVSWANQCLSEHPSTISALLMGSAWCIANLGPTWAGLISKTVSIQPIISTLYIMSSLMVVAFFLVLITPQGSTAKTIVD
ncbi:MFS transporter [Candidatus Rhabdochlamydia porcellionis]|jgi:MFS transporter, FSR family, fosmidomycin resistance protein|uniref:Major Facilitator Superfamily n=1 Tax=Candidatus Rhabdochlamydia porcellionis TaxID=225148 RepID=A0ABX8Z362_9BACT|nr:MFS transporter [Candidatus Rhabdochlamydia porcellionis]QZA59333.1 Major Facilitator Superfamily [Candidatus Rhabdochlamydia porcellionis]